MLPLLLLLLCAARLSTAIKDDSQALGAVDASGINHSKLASGRSGWNRLLRLCGIGRWVFG